MDSTPEYVPYLLGGQVKAARMLGVEPYLVARETYVLNLSTLTLIGMIAKALADKGIVSDQEWLTRLNTAYQGPWPAWMINQVNPDKPVDPGST